MLYLVLGAPVLSVQSLDSQVLSFTITPPSISVLNKCILSYNITPTDSSGTVLADITVEVTRPLMVSVNSSGFNLCNTTYNFTVVAVTAAGPGERSTALQIPPLSMYNAMSNVKFHLSLTCGWIGLMS